MANFNLNVTTFPFFDSVKHPLAESGISKSYWNNGYDNLTFEISGEGSGNIVVEGCVNTVNENGEQLADDELTWVPLSMLNASDYTQNAILTKKGIYFVGVLGISRVRVNATNVTGNLTLVGNFTK